MKFWAMGLALFVAALAGSCAAKVEATTPAAAPATASATGPSASSAEADAKPANKFPTPAELMAKIQAAQKKEETEPKVPYFDLSSSVGEKPADYNFFGGDPNALTLRVLVERLEKARQDGDVHAVLLRLGDGALNLSQAMELRDELQALHRDGKRTFVYADSLDTAGYIAASGATDICMMEGGEIMIPGVGFETMFAKGLLDKVGVKADFVQIGEYKGADEEFTRTDASPELKGQLNKLADSLYGQIIDTISASRNLKVEDVRRVVDEALIPGDEAKAQGLVDHLVDIGGLRDLMTSELGQKTNLVWDYGQTDKNQLDLSSPFALFAMLSRKPAESTKPTIAMIYAEGMIVDGPSADGLFSQAENIGSDTMREALRTAEKDDKIKAVVIRIDSPGGSALASEAMWQAARRVSKVKPVIISVGSMAASGGYYLASSGDYIFADPTGIVGSIGVVGGKFVLTDLFTKVGLNTEAFVRGKNADLFSSTIEWDPKQREQLTHWMRATYDQFTKRVMTTRKGKIKDIDAVARGRIFAAQEAKDLGMVDQIGGIQDAIGYAAKDVDLKPGEYDVRVLPAPKTLAELLNGSSSASDEDSAMRFSPRMSMEARGLFAAMGPAMQRALGMELDELMLLQRRPVMLASPVMILVR